MKIDRFYPYIMILIAVVGLYINYRQYLDAKHECECQKAPAATGSTLRMM